MTAPENLEPVIQQKDELEEEKTPARKKPTWLKRRGALVFNLAVFAVVALLLGGAGMLAFGPWAIPFALVLGAFAANAVHIAFVWERAVILRFGNFSRIAEPGLYFTIPIVEQIALHVDQRINATSFLNERALTSDLAPVDVDAVVFWMVWDPKKACLAVEDYEHSASLVAQTALRDAIGQVEIAELSMQRAHIDHQLKKSIEEKTEQWGVTINDVEIRDIRMPQELQNAMSAEAQAQQERNARVVLAEVEKDISDMFIEAAHAYREDDLALQLRMMSLVNESVKEGGNMVVVPSPYAQGFTGDIASALKGKK